MLNIGLKVQECDATKHHTFTKAGNKNFIFKLVIKLFLLFNFYFSLIE